MRIGDRSWRTLWPDDDEKAVRVIDQTKLPDAFETVRLETVGEVAKAIRTMVVRGAPLIGVTAAYGMALALRDDGSDASLESARSLLLASRPTAVNLRWAVDRVARAVAALEPKERGEAAWGLGAALADEDVAACASIGKHGAELLMPLVERAGGRPLRVLTHCNAGWLATVDRGTALSPVYELFDRGVPIEVWVDETRPRDQGYLTAWELGEHGVPYTLIADNAGGHLMQRGQVDVCIVGSDRTTRRGDVCNKIGTYLKALAAKDNGLPFYAAVPASTIDLTLTSGDEIEIEERDPREVTRRPWVKAQNPAFDVTPSHLVTAVITEHGVALPNEASLREVLSRRG